MPQKRYIQAMILGMLAFLALAAPTLSQQPPAGTPSVISTFLSKLTLLIFRIAVALGVIFLIYIGIKYIVSGGEGVKNVHQFLIWLLIGLALVFLAASFPNIVKDFVSR